MSEKSVFSNATEPSLADGRRDPESVGEQLRAAREARNLTLAEAAQSLKLAPRQVAAIENEDWSSLPGTTMIRGFVRNYARVLNLDADALMRGLDATRMQRTLQLEASAGTSSTLPQAGSQAEQRDYLAVVGGLVLLVLALLAYFYVPQDFWKEQLAALTGGETKESPADSVVSAGGPVPTVTEGVPPAGVAPANSGASGPVSVTTPIVPDAKTPPAAPAVATLAAAATSKADDGSLTSSAVKAEASAEVKRETAAADILKLNFAQAAWVEVRDSRGEVLAFGVKPAGTQQEVKGQPPFSLVLGNATYVSVEYKGKPVDLAPHISKGVARLSLQ